MSNPIAAWDKVGDRFYRKVKLYDAVFDEDLELENYTVTGAPYGGAIGMMDLDTPKFILIAGQHSIVARTSFRTTEEMQ